MAVGARSAASIPRPNQSGSGWPSCARSSLHSLLLRMLYTVGLAITACHYEFQFLIVAQFVGILDILERQGHPTGVQP